MRFRIYVLLAMLAGLSSQAAADELADLKARNAQLEATVEELTLQLATAISERKQLEAMLEAATTAMPAEAAMAAGAPASEESASAQSAPTAANSGKAVAVLEEEVIASPNPQPVARANTPCDVSRALRGYDGSGDDNQALSDWLTTGNQVKRCSTEELQRLREAVSWDWFGYQKAVYAIIDKELKER